MAKKAETYEKAMERLEEIVSQLGEGNLPLDDMMKLYEEGAAIADRCRAMLEDYQAKLEAIEKKRGADDDGQS
mgnify:CR=1 FL=1